METEENKGGQRSRGSVTERCTLVTSVAVVRLAPLLIKGRQAGLGGGEAEEN